MEDALESVLERRSRKGSLGESGPSSISITGIFSLTAIVGDEATGRRFEVQENCIRISWWEVRWEARRTRAALLCMMKTDHVDEEGSTLFTPTQCGFTSQFHRGILQAFHHEQTFANL